MIIVSQDRNLLVNLDNVDMIYINQCCPTVIECMMGASCCALGEYDTEEDCRKAFRLLQEDIRDSGYKGAEITKKERLYNED